MSRDFRATVPDEAMNQVRIFQGKYGVDTNGEVLQELLKTAIRVDESEDLELGNRSDDLDLFE